MKAVADACTDIGAHLAVMAGTPIDDITIPKKVMQLHSPAAISLSVNYWCDLICEYQHSLGKIGLANDLRMQINKFSSAISKYHLSVHYKAATPVYFNAVIKAWVDSNKDLALRTPLDRVATDLMSNYVTLASTLEQQQTATENESSKKRAEKSKPQGQFRRPYFQFKANYDKTADGETICRNYNRGSCTMRFCNYKHICNYCSTGPHPAIRCPKKQTNGTATTNPKPKN